MKAVHGLSAVVAAIGCAIGASRAQEPVSRPESAGRLVQSFDFNQHLPTPLPFVHWYRGQSAPTQGRLRPGFPVWNGAKVDYDSPAFEGAGSLMLPTEGGSTSVRLRQGVIPVFAAADYLITAMVRTSGLTHAGAMLEAWQVDEAGLEIQGSRVRSQVIRSDQAWTPVGVEILGSDPNAAFIQIEMLLLQPRELEGPFAEPEKFKVWSEDYSGAAWFDAVSIHQLPRIEIATTHKGNVVRAPERPELNVFVRDLAGEPLNVEMTVTDLWGNLVDSHTSRLQGGRFTEHWHPELSRLGWYRSVVRLRDDSGEVVGGTRCDFLWLGPDQDHGRSGVADAMDSAFHPGTGRERFGLGFGPLSNPLIQALPELVRAAGVGSVKLPIWDEQGDAEAQRNRLHLLAPQLEQLLLRGVEFTFAFSQIPTPLAQATGLDLDQPTAVFSQPSEFWHGYTDPSLDRYGQRVRRWQLGRDGDEAINGQTQEQLQIARTELSRLVPGPIVTIPWRSDQHFPDHLIGPNTRLSLLMVGGADDRAMQMLASDWDSILQRVENEQVNGLTQGSPPELELTFSVTPQIPFGHAASVPDLIKRAVLAVSAFGRFGGPSSSSQGAARSGVPVVFTMIDPVSENAGQRRGISPTPALGAWGQLVDRLAGREIVSEIQLAQGVRCFVLEPSPGVSQQRGGALILWADNAQAPSTLEIYLGSSPVRAADLFGNQSPIQQVQSTGRHHPPHRIDVSSDPIYIEGVDTQLVTMLTSIRLDPGLIEAKNTVHEHELIIENPWNTPVRGKVFVLEPGGYSVLGGEIDRRWIISPRVIEFTIPPNGQARLPLAIELSAGTPAGTKPFVLDLEIRAGRDYGLVRVHRTIELGLSELSMQVYPRIGSSESSTDVFLEVEVTNNTDRPMNLDLTSVVPGFPRGKATISGIKPGETILRSFALPNALDQVRGAQAAVSLTESGGTQGIRLIKSITID